MATDLIDIRLAGPADADNLTHIHDEAWRLAYAGIIPFPHLDRMIARRSPDWWRLALAGGSEILALDFDRRPAGYASIGPARRGPRRGAGEIYELYLRPEYQGVGLGRRLFAASRKRLEARGRRGLIVWALEENEGACSFYRRMGGEVIGRSSDRYGERAVARIAFGWDRLA